MLAYACCNPVLGMQNQADPWGSVAANLAYQVKSRLVRDSVSKHKADGS